MPRNANKQPMVVRGRAMKKKQVSSGARQERKSAIPSIHGMESRTAKYYMFTHKIGNGRRPLTLKNGVYNYGPSECGKSFNGSGRCAEGSKCVFAHSWAEVLFHPLFYKTKVCLRRKSCVQGAERCAFAHSNEDFRILRNILGANWRSRDPASSRKMKMGRKKVEGKKKNEKIKKEEGARPGRSEDSMSVTSDAWSSRRSAVSAGSPSLVDSVSSSMSVSVSMSGACEEVEWREKERKEERRSEEDDDVALAVVENECDGDDEKEVKEEEEEAQRMSEFGWWFTNMFDAGQCMGEYLCRFEENGLDDLEFLWELYRDDGGRDFRDAMVNVIGMEDDATREVFGQTLCEYMNPVDAGEWMERVVGLGEYVRVFGKFGSVDAVVDMCFDDGALAEMGISSEGHRIKILFELRKAHEKMVAGGR